MPCLVACAGNAPAPAAPARSAAPEPARKTASAAAEAPLDPDKTLGTADSIYRDQLGVAARDDRFAVDRQVASLRQSIELYRQFIDRAAGDPRFTEAVRRSEGRIEDAQKTIDFLLGKPSAD